MRRRRLLPQEFAAEHRESNEENMVLLPHDGPTSINTKLLFDDRVSSSRLHLHNSYHFVRRVSMVASTIIDCICLALYVAVNELQWNGRVVAREPISDILTIIINVLSGLHLLLIGLHVMWRISYVRLKAQSQFESTSAAGRGTERINFRIAAVMWVSSGSHWYYTLVECVLLVPQPFLAIDPFVASAIGMFMFLRLFFGLGRIVLEFSTFSRSSQSLASKALFNRSKRSRFATLPFKALLFVYPLQFLSFVLVSGQYTVWCHQIVLIFVL
jgi:hypothetical protein